MSRRRQPPRAGNPGSRGEPGPRTEGRDYVVSGHRRVAELLELAPQRIERLLLDRGQLDSALATRAQDLGVPLQWVSPRELADAAMGGPAKGALAYARAPAYQDVEDLIQAALPAGLLVALDQVVDPQNLGAILRTSEFFGVRGVFWPQDGSAPLSAAAVRAAAGASERLPMGRVVNLARALEACKAAGLWVVGTVPEDGLDLEQALAEDRLPQGLVVVLGGEEQGLRRLTRERCDYLVTIPRLGPMASLNVSTAAAVVLARLALSRAGR